MTRNPAIIPLLLATCEVPRDNPTDSGYWST